MSSKRKNTPTKLPKDDVVSERQFHAANLDCDNNLDSEGENESHLHIVTHSDSETQDSDSSVSERPPSKKQRILDRVKQESDSENDSSSQISPQFITNNNHILTKPSLGLQRKSMDSVLKKLGSKSDSDMENSQAAAANGEEPMAESIQLLLRDGSSPSEKERRLSEMIAQLQNLKENINKTKVNNLFFFRDC